MRVGSNILMTHDCTAASAVSYSIYLFGLLIVMALNVLCCGAHMWSQYFHISQHTRRDAGAYVRLAQTQS